MKALLVIFALGLTAVSAFPSAEVKHADNEWALIPDGNGRLHLMNLKEAEFKSKLRPRVETVAEFLLYTRANPNTPQKLYLADADGLRQSNFDARRPTRFIIHGFLNDGYSEVNGLIRKAYLARGDYNIIVVDWSSGSATIDYIYARNQVPIAGTQCGRFMNFLSTQGVSFNDIYCIGHSLGSHVCGFCGKAATNGKMNTIFALDPAFPLFDMNKPNERLNENDAVYVQSIHTNAGLLGFKEPIGPANFYPAWGGLQPGCPIDVTGTCSHLRSYKYFAETLNQPDNFIGGKCASMDSIYRMKCPYQGIAAPMGGEPANHSITGIYYLPVNSKSPYAKGNVF